MKFLAGMIVVSILTVLAVQFLFGEEPPTMRAGGQGFRSLLATEPAESLCEQGARLNCEEWNEDWLFYDGAEQVGLILDGYRASNQDRAGLGDKLVEHAVHTARDEPVQRGIPQVSTSAITDDGFPVLWSITWKTQGASWMLRNRRVIEAAIS